MGLRATAHRAGNGLMSSTRSSRTLLWHLILALFSIDHCAPRGQQRPGQPGAVSFAPLSARRWGAVDGSPLLEVQTADGRPTAELAWAIAHRVNHPPVRAQSDARANLEDQLLAGVGCGEGAGRVACGEEGWRWE
eukprot:SAG11_NODE_850_length_6868_cov_3.543523_5_plen_135_part_00